MASGSAPQAGPIIISGAAPRTASSVLGPLPGSTSGQSILLEGISVSGFTDGNGYVIHHHSAQPLSIRNSKFKGGAFPILFRVLGPMATNPLTFECINVITDNPLPLVQNCATRSALFAA